MALTDPPSEQSTRAVQARARLGRKSSLDPEVNQEGRFRWERTVFPKRRYHRPR